MKRHEVILTIMSNTQKHEAHSQNLHADNTYCNQRQSVR